MDPISPKDTASVVAIIRKYIIDGKYPPGTRLAEIPVSETLGVSRTPVRIAFGALAQEGLLQTAGKRGYVVRAFSSQDVLRAIDVRGVLEGLAARQLAEQGMSVTVHDRLQACIAAGEEVLGRGALREEDIGAWSALNESFHQCIVEADGSRVIADAIARNNHLPFASAASLVIDKTALDKEYQKLRLAQVHHRLVFDALKARESARVEALMREHAQIALRYGQLFGLAPGLPSS